MLMPNILQGFGLEMILIAEIGYLWFQSLKNRRTATLSAFFNLCSALMLFLLINIPVRMSDLNLVKWDAETVYVFNAFFILFEILTAYEWFAYFLTVRGIDLSKRGGLKTLAVMPIVLMIILLILSYSTGWLFYVDENGVYTRGSLFFLQILLPYAYLAASFVGTIRAYKTNRNRRLLAIFLVAFLSSAAASVLQVFCSGSFTHAGLSLAVIFLYMEMYQYEIKQIENVRSLGAVNAKLEAANEKLNETVKELEISMANEKAASNAKNDFLSRMSHDIRTPLNGILGLIEIDDRHPDDVEFLAQNRKKARTSAEHLLSLINEILDMSKLSSGKYEFSHEPFVMSEIIDEVFTMSHSTAEARKVTLVDENADDASACPVTYGSPLHISRILLNIIGNAIKYNKEDGRVSVRVDHEYAGDDRINYQIAISDTGIGMSEEYQEKLFEPFSQESIDARSVYNGSGLGMAITKALIDQMGGSIRVESRLGEGTTFFISLTFEIAPEEQTAEETPEETGALEGLRVLLVEDNELNMEIAQSLLEDYGADVECAGNGQIAYEKFTGSPEGTYDVILMDCMMPVMDGYEATRTIRKEERPDALTIPIIAMTANAFADDIRQCLDAGMNDHLAKPFDIDTVVKVIRRYAGH